jgi:hypothetical protein
VPSRTNQTDALGAPSDTFTESPLEHVRSLFIRFVQLVFYGQPPGSYHWDPADDVTELFLSNESPIHTESLGRRPGVSFTRGPVQFSSLGLDDMLEYDPRTGRKTKSVLIPGVMSLNVISRVPLECENIGFRIAERLWAEREVLMREGFFEIGRSPMIGAPTPAGTLVAGDSGDEYVAVVVSCPYQFYRTTAITPLGHHIVNGVEMRLRPQMGFRQNKGTSIGAEIHMCPPDPYSPASDAYGHSPSAGEQPPGPLLATHPFNPAQRVFVKPVNPLQQGLRPPSIGGRVIPITRTCVAESELQIGDESRIKV